MWYLIIGMIWMTISGIILLICEKMTNSTVMHELFLMSMICKLVIWPIDIVYCIVNLYRCITINGYSDTVWDEITEENETD